MGRCLIWLLVLDTVIFLNGENNIKVLLILGIIFIFPVLMGRTLVTCAMGICKKLGMGQMRWRELTEGCRWRLSTLE